MFKTQPTIDNFFISNKNTKKYEIKRYFYLIWENKYRPNVNAYWTNIKPEKINFIEQISCDYIKKGYYFYICGYFPDINENSYYLTKEKTYKNVPYLKSHLQKCIRKQNDILAVSTCYHLLKLNLQELLRRLPIIMLEDTTLHESFSTLIWLMIVISSCKNFKIKQNIYEYVLGIIYVLCKLDKKDIIQEENTEQNINIPEVLDKYIDLKESEYSILYSIHLRIAYGGLDDDIKMLKNYYKIWEERFRNKTKSVENMLVRPISIYVKELDLQYWDLSAIDYYCNSNFLDYVSKKFDEINVEELKKIIWYHSSSINNRIKNKEYDLKKWNLIKDYVVKTQKYLLDSNY